MRDSVSALAAEDSNSTENSQEANMFRRFAQLALAGRPDDSWGEMALKTQEVLDACLRSARSGGATIALRHEAVE